MTDTTLQNKNVLVTGGSRGLGLGIVEALVARGARVTVLARDAGRLAEVAARLGVATRAGDVTDPKLAKELLHELRPDVLVLNAGASPGLGALDTLSWDDFRSTWETDVKSTFFWLQGALRMPLAKGSRVLVASSGAAVNGSPMSGGYAGAKRTQWLITQYAAGVAKERGLDIRFQVLVPRQMIGDTALGRAGAEVYAKKKGVSVEAFLAGFGKALTPRELGEHVATILGDPRYADGMAFGVKGDTGIVSLDG